MSTYPCIASGSCRTSYPLRGCSNTTVAKLKSSKEVAGNRLSKNDQSVQATNTTALLDRPTTINRLGFRLNSNSRINYHDAYLYYLEVNTPPT